VKLLSDAEALAEALGDRQRLARLLAQKGVGLWAQGRYGEALECGRRAFDLATALGDRSSEIDAGYVLGMVNFTLGNFTKAIEILSGALRRLGEQRFPARFQVFYAVSLRVGLALALGPLGQLAEGFENAAEAERLAEATGDSHLLSMVDTALGVLHLERGELGAAIQILERGIEICERAALATTLTELSVELGRSYAYSGRADEGARLIEQALERAGTEIGLYAGEWQMHLGEACLRAGRRDEARRIAERALELCRARGQRAAEAQCLQLRGEIASSDEPPDLEVADARYREALALGGELGMRPFLARCHVRLGVLERRAGRRASARRSFDTAASLFSEIGAFSWLESVEAEARVVD